MAYKHYPERPAEMTAEFVREEYEKLIERIEAADRSESPEEWLGRMSVARGAGAAMHSQRR